MSFGSPYSSPSASKEKIDDNQEVKKYPEDFPVTYLPNSVRKPGGNPTYTLKAKNFLYRGSKNPYLPLEDLIGIQWYALDLPDVFQYGYPSKYEINTDLNLLAIDKIEKDDPFFTGLDETMKNKFNKFIRYDDEGKKQRVSIAQNDYDVCEYICSLGYDGYAMNKMKSDIDGEFHAEVALNNGIDKLILIEHINVDKVTDKNGQKLTDNSDEPITNAYLDDKVIRNKQRAEGLKGRNKPSKRSYLSEGSSLKFNPMIMDEDDNDEDDEPFRIQGKPTIFNFESPPKRQNTGPISPQNIGPSNPLPFSYSSPYSSPSIKTGGKTKKRNRKTKKNKKKQTKKKNKKSKRKSNKNK